MTMTNGSARWRQLVVALYACATTTACASLRPPVEGAVGAQPGGRAPTSSCERAAMVDDGEDGDNRILVTDGRGGYLYTFKDDRGTTVLPTGEFTIASGGALGSRGAMRFHGKLGDVDSVYAGLGASLTEPKAPYDASRYTGIAFYARRGSESTAAVRLKLPDVDTDPDGRVCTECYNDFGADFQVGEEWTRYVVSFSDLYQGAGWGAPRPKALDPRKLYSVQWQVATRGAPFDIWIDDVTFVGCP